MADDGFAWIYLLFFIIPLARIIPRMIRKWQRKNNPAPESQFYQTNPFEQKTETYQKPQDIEMQVLGEINRGIKDFNQIQRNLKIENQKLENILTSFEEQGLMKVVKKGGFFGEKIELHPTEKGSKKFYS